MSTKKTKTTKNPMLERAMSKLRAATAHMLAVAENPESTNINHYDISQALTAVRLTCEQLYQIKRLAIEIELP